MQVTRASQAIDEGEPMKANPQRSSCKRILGLVGVVVAASIGGGLTETSAKTTTPSVPADASYSSVAILDRLLVNGLVLSTGERSCAIAAASKADTSRGPATTSLNGRKSAGNTTGFSARDYAVGHILRCVSQEHAIDYIAGSLDRQQTTGSAPSGARSPSSSASASKKCLIRRLQVATWPEVSEAFRAYADAVLADFDDMTMQLLASRVQPYVRTCISLQDGKGITPLSAPTLEEVRLRWNAAIGRHGAVLSAVTRWRTATQVGLPTTGLSTGPSPAKVAIVALHSWVDIALATPDRVSDSGASTSGSALAGSLADPLPKGSPTISGATIVLEPPSASESVATEALFVLADAIDGRDQANIVSQSIDIPGLLASGRAAERRARIGRTYYGVVVVVNPVRIFVSAYPS